MKRIVAAIFIFTVLFMVNNDLALAHPGKLDSKGGHYCRTNCEKWGLSYGQYHYHNGGGSSAPAPKPAPAPKQAPAPKPAPAPIRSIEKINFLLKSNLKEKVLLVDLLLAEASRLTTSSDAQVINATNKAYSRAVGATQEPKAIGEHNYYYVSSVTDGDTIKVVIDGKIEKVRLLGIDTPETKDPRKPVQCFGKESSNYSKNLMEGQYVRLEKDPTQGDKDKYNRLLRYVYLSDNTDVNAKLLEQGFAIAYVRYPVLKMDMYKVLQKQAEEKQLGLWAACR